MKALALPICLGLSACASPLTNEPSLARRPAEAIDPRVPIASEPVIGPVDAALATQLQALVADGRAGGTAFYSEAARARSLAAVAGPAQTESWIVAQEALSALEAARSRLTKALSDIDELASARIQSGGLSAGDQAAIEAASGNLRAIGERQSEVLAEISGRLAR